MRLWSEDASSSFKVTQCQSRKIQVGFFLSERFGVFNLGRVYKVPPLNCCMGQLIAAAYACTGALRSLLYRTVLVVLLDDDSDVDNSEARGRLTFLRS